jgi:alkylhydroperoxidase/carboxymuconolactone decarboxylase family protein YurZ
MDRAAWVEIPTEQELGWSAEGAGGYEFGFLPAMGRLIMAHPGIGPAFVQLLSTVMFGPGSLSRRERELVAGVSAAAQDCFY